MSASKTTRTTLQNGWSRSDPHGRQERSEAFLSNGTDQQGADDKHDMVARPSLGWLLTLQRGAHQPHLRRSDQQHEALGKQGHNEQRNTDH